MRQSNLSIFDSFDGIRFTDTTVADICNYTASGDRLLVMTKPADRVSPDVVKLQGVQLPNMSLDSNVLINDSQGESFIPVPTKIRLFLLQWLRKGRHLHILSRHRI